MDGRAGAAGVIAPGHGSVGKSPRADRGFAWKPLPVRTVGLRAPAAGGG
jgi:hypothetical protein